MLRGNCSGLTVPLSRFREALFDPIDKGIVTKRRDAKDGVGRFQETDGKHFEFGIIAQSPSS